MFGRSVTGLVLEESGTVTAVSVAASLRSVEVNSAGSWQGEGEDVFARWSSAISQAALAGVPLDSVVMGLPAGRIFKRSMSFPFSSRSRIRQVLASELEGDIPVPADSVTADLLVTESGRDGASGIAIACDIELVKQAINILPAETELLGVQSDSVGLASAVLALGGENTAAAYCSPDSSYSTVVSTSSGVLESMRTVFDKGNYGPASLAGVISDLAGPSGSLLLECGGQNDALRAELDAISDLSISGARALKMPDGAVGRMGDQAGRYLPALGLALAGSGAKGTLQMDLRQGPLSPSSQLFELKTPLIRTAVILAVVIALAAAVSAGRYSAGKAQFEAVKNKMDSAYAELFPGDNINNAEAQMKAKLSVQQRVYQDLAGFGGAGALDVLAALSRDVPAQSGLRIVELSLDGSKLRFDGTVNSFDSVDQVQEALEKTPLFHDVKIQNARVAADASKVSFRLQMEVAVDAGVP
jgi:general secretion pathway protein L